MADPRLEPTAAYVHIPFCAHHCGYCDFAVTAGQDHLAELYFEAVREELRLLGVPRPVKTIFVGGGTPTHLSAPQLDRLFIELNQWFPVAGRTEVSVESTPDSLSAEKLAVLNSRSVTRVSVGIQSFDVTSLVSLDRLHRTSHIEPAVNAVREAGMELSLDLIFAAPGSTIQTWADDLAAAIRLNPDHISTYGLTYEKGTPLWKQRRAGAVVPVPEDDELAMYELSMDTLAAAGYEHYEVSNFAKPGKRCRHNETYWANEAYFGVGVGAARYVNGVRELNVRNTNDYIRRVLSGESPTFQSERLDDRERAFETIGTQLRRADGIGRARFREQTGFSLDDLVGERVRSLLGHGLLTDDGDRVRLTRRGFCLADGVVVELMKKR